MTDFWLSLTLIWASGAIIGFLAGEWLGGRRW